jgi:hypothetical protein
MSENKAKTIEYNEYVTIDGAVPEVNKSFFISKRFKVMVYSLATVLGIIVYFVVSTLF